MYEIVSDLFNIEDTKDYILSIQINLGGFSFCVVSSEHELIVYKNVPLTITSARFLTRRFEEWYENEEILKKQFKEVNFIYNTHEFALIPDKYYEASENYALLKTVLDIDNEIQTEANKVDALDLWVVYTFPKLLRVKIGQRFPKIKISHLLKNCLGNIPEINSGENRMILLFNSNYLYLLLFEKDKFIMANSFLITHRNDIIFFSLSVLKHYKIQANRTKLFLGGIIYDEEKIIDDVKKYFSSIHYLQSPAEIKINEEIFHTPNYHLYSLLSSI